MLGSSRTLTKFCSFEKQIAEKKYNVSFFGVFTRTVYQLEAVWKRNNEKNYNTNRCIENDTFLN